MELYNFFKKTVVFSVIFTISGLRAENWGSTAVSESYKQMCLQLETKKMNGELTPEQYEQAKAQCARFNAAV